VGFCGKLIQHKECRGLHRWGKFHIVGPFLASGSSIADGARISSMQLLSETLAD
jgi:hypothetical protein